MKKLGGVVFALALVFALNVAVVAPAHAETTTTTNIASLMETLKSLLAKVAELQAELAKIRGDVQDAIQVGLKEGMSDDDIKEIQELLASDSDIYPEGLVTGYYGRLTKEAVLRFQKRHNLPETGIVDQETHDLLEEYLNERFDDKVPAGLLRAPGIFKKVHDSACDRHGKGGGAWGIFCKDWDDDDDDDDSDEDEDDDDSDEDEDEDEDDDENDDEDEFEVEVEIEDGETTVSFTLDGEDYSVEVNSTSESEVLDAVAEELDEDLEDIDEDLIDEIKDELADAVEEVDEDESSEEDAQDALDDAQDDIDAVQADIDDADEDVDTNEAQDALDDAQALLDDAQDAFDDEDFTEAEELAEEAEDKASEAADLLEEAEEDAA